MGNVREEELVQHFARGAGSVFVGAGVSRGTGLPNWAELVAPLAEELGDCPPGFTVLEIAQFYENRFRREQLYQKVRRALRVRQVRPTALHEAIAGLPVRHFYTTNYDQLLEDAFEAAGREYTRIVRDEDVSSLDPSGANVIKLHGDIEQKSTLVLTSADYETQFSSRSTLADLLALELQTRTLLFVGYSFADLDLRLLLQNMRRRLGEFRRTHFTLQLDPSAHHLDELRRLGLEVIPIPRLPGGDDTQAVRAWIDAFRRRVADVPLRPAFAGTDEWRTFRHNLRARRRTLVGEQHRAAYREAVALIAERQSMVALVGFPGIGKTRIALEVGHDIAARMSGTPPADDGFASVVWISARERAGHPAWSAETVETIARVIGHQAIAERATTDVDAKWRDVLQILGKQRVLLIVDNVDTAADEQLMQRLDEVPEPSQVLVTAYQAHPLSGARRVAVSGLSREDAVQFLRDEARPLRIDALARETDAALGDLAHAVGGNPQALISAVGLIQDGVVDVAELTAQLSECRTGAETDPLFATLHARAWAALGESGRRVLYATPLFVSGRSMRRDLLQAATGLVDDEGEFDVGLAQCMRLRLLEVEPSVGAVAEVNARGERRPAPSVRYVLHPITRAFARRMLDQLPAEVQRDAQARLSDALLAFVRWSVERRTPDRRYWNALVSDGMRTVDGEWRMVRRAVGWAMEARDTDRLVDFVMLLVHYLDSRFHNRERIELVKAAVELLAETDRRADEVLLRIDALGWTYVEDGDYAAARASIERGLQAVTQVQDAEREDLHALGLAWLARLSVQEAGGDAESVVARAERQIGAAIEFPMRPWIRCRVHMAAGDICMKRQMPDAALDHYRIAREEAASYGDEGHGYQIAPRMGLAYLALDPPALDAAEREFGLVEDAEEIGHLYAQYGRAMVAYQRGDRERARRDIDAVRAAIDRRTTFNLLLQLIDESHAQIERKPAATRPG